MTDRSDPALILHGGAGSAIDDEDRASSVEESLCTIRDELYPALARGADGQTVREVVVEASRRLEADPLFNAGRGSVLQSDGRARLSASLMTADPARFSAVINAERVRHPVELASELQDRTASVLGHDGAVRLARELRMEPFDPVTEARLDQWVDQRRSEIRGDASETDEENDAVGCGTVGAVARDRSGEIAAATSTGGRGFEDVGRVSDSAMPAGNYATRHAGVSCTGVGEDIVDECAAVRIAVRVADGDSLERAFERSFDEARRRQRQFGGVGVAADGEIAWGKTTDVLLAAWRTEGEGGHAVDAAEEPRVAAV